MFKVKSKTNPSVTHTVYAVVPCGTLILFSRFHKQQFHIDSFGRFRPRRINKQSPCRPTQFNKKIKLCTRINFWNICNTRAAG